MRHGHHSRHSLLAGRRTADILAALLALKPEAMDEVMASIQNKEPRRLVRKRRGGVDGGADVDGASIYDGEGLRNTEIRRV